MWLTIDYFCIVKVGIVLYNNLSSSLSPEDSTKSIISPVISIAVNHSGCVRGPRGGCVISNLSNPVEIVFNLQNNYQVGVSLSGCVMGSPCS